MQDKTPNNPQLMWGQATQEPTSSPLKAVSDLRLMTPPSVGKSLPTQELMQLLEGVYPLPLGKTLMHRVAERHKLAAMQASPVAMGHPL